MFTSCGHILCIQNYLYCNKGYLYRSSCAYTSQYLVSDPSSSTRVDFESMQECGTDGKYGSTKPHERSIPAKDGNTTADSDGGKGDADEIWNRSDTGSFGGCSLDGLKVKGEVEDVAGKG